MKACLYLFASAALTLLVLGCGSPGHSLISNSTPQATPTPTVVPTPSPLTLLFGNPPTVTSSGNGVAMGLPFLSDGDVNTRTILTAGGNGSSVSVKTIGLTIPGLSNPLSFTGGIKITVFFSIPSDDFVDSGSSVGFGVSIFNNGSPAGEVLSGHQQPVPGVNTFIATFPSSFLGQFNSTTAFATASVISSAAEPAENQAELDILDVQVELLP